jgi:histidinol-phosphate aminotransferase
MLSFMVGKLNTKNLKTEIKIEMARPVLDLSPYQATSSLEDIHAKPEQVPLKLDWNESTILPSPKVATAIKYFLEHDNHLNWYSTLNSTNLIHCLSEFYQIPKSYFLVSNGSDEALHTICATYLYEGDEVLVPSPTYQHFLVFARQEGAKITELHASNPFESNVDELIEALQAKYYKLCYLVSPNNPTGVCLENDEIERLLESSPNTLFILDEAYAEFARNSAYPLVKRYSNLLITRTFSKAYALAGLRIGYVMSNEQLIANLSRVFNPKSVNVLGQIAAMAALSDQAYLENFVTEVEKSQAFLIEELKKREIVSHPSKGNFMMIKVKEPKKLVKALAVQGVYVRDRAHLLEGYVRITLGTLEQTKDFLKRLDLALEQIS